MSSITLKDEHDRYFTNPVFEDPSNLASQIDEKWLLEKAELLAKRLTTHHFTEDEYRKGGCYTGPGGISLALLRLALIEPEKKDAFLDSAQTLMDNHLGYTKKAYAEKVARYLTVTAGLYFIQVLLYKFEGKSAEKMETLIKRLREMVDSVLDSDFENEILNGRAGFLAGVLMLKRLAGLEIIPHDVQTRIVKKVIKEGRKYSHESNSPAPLMYEWHKKEYLGAAHGISGIYQILLCYSNLLDDSEKADLKHSIDWFLTIQTAEGNFPSSSGWIGKPKGEDELVHWCHGAPGVIQLLITAYLKYQGELKYFEAAVKAADLIWKKGILEKGPGLCHGLSGNGYAFLLMYRLTSDEEYLNMAKAFAAIMMDPNFESLARTPDNPYSLFEGWAGALCFVCDLVNPSFSNFPMVPIPFGNPDFP